MPANINKVEDLARSQEDKPRKQFTMENCVTDWHTFGLSLHNYYQLMCFNILSNVCLLTAKPIIYKHGNIT